MTIEEFERIRGFGGNTGVLFTTTRRSKDSQGRLQYFGRAPAGSATSDATWIIWKTSYDTPNNGDEYTQVCDFSYPTALGVIWDNRDSVTYRT